MREKRRYGPFTAILESEARTAKTFKVLDSKEQLCAKIVVMEHDVKNYDVVIYNWNKKVKKPILFFTTEQAFEESEKDIIEYLKGKESRETASRVVR